jgi:hypothetical protein
VPIVSVVTGVVLMALGIGFYFGTDQVSVTALIPAFFGLPLAVLGLVAMREQFLKHAMHGAAALGLIGFLGGLVMAVRGLIKSSGEVGNATVEQALMALVCAAFVGLCVRSFILARRRRSEDSR